MKLTPRELAVLQTALQCLAFVSAECGGELDEELADNLAGTEGPEHQTLFDEASDLAAKFTTAAYKDVVAAAGQALEQAYPWGYRSGDGP